MSRDGAIKMSVSNARNRKRREPYRATTPATYPDSFPSATSAESMAREGRVLARRPIEPEDSRTVAGESRAGRPSGLPSSVKNARDCLERTAVASFERRLYRAISARFEPRREKYRRSFRSNRLASGDFPPRNASAAVLFAAGNKFSWTRNHSRCGRSLTKPSCPTDDPVGSEREGGGVRIRDEASRRAERRAVGMFRARRSR